MNGFEIGLHDDKRCLMRHGKVMKTSPLSDVMEDFLEEMKSIRAQVNGRIVLIGYNSKAYDMEVMKEEFLRCGVSADKISTMNVVCADLLQLIRKNCGHIFPGYYGDLRMTSVYNMLCRDQKKYSHDALEDAEKLRAIYRAIISLVDKQAFERHIFPFPAVAPLPSDNGAVIPAQGTSEGLPPLNIKRKSVDSDPYLDGPDVKKARF